MKKINVIILSALLAYSLVACGNSSEEKASKEDSQTNTYASADISDDITAVDDIQLQEENPEEVQSVAGDPSVDVDLTVLSATLIYSEVFNMVTTPADYEGKTVKMEGTCNMYQDPDTGKKYYACIVQDATQCCSQGLEFVLDENTYTEDDYPKVGDDITIKGTFTTYQENGNTYLTMLDSTLI